ncbi:glycosyltransferase family 39 protein [Dysgonomonas sp. HGC4]|uniref:glycosyltransferase family 39 protein n=1 Tax=Dysgonomonas sp. HGC4 TaxID=1658009 RepID=UPI0006814453|nr:glycosyltransferase family 39 protein [Dysgonomonas sp. HGC4]MBD8346562.1 glycosyltransferase family 39 protein [Dysgonomonas sp. HGC4]
MNTKTGIFWAFIIAKFIIQYFLISPEYDLHRDEYLHIDQAYHLAWGYASVPPLTSWLSSIILLLGKSEFVVKLFPALFGALTIAVVWKTIEELKGNLFALVLGATAILFSSLLRINTLYQPNSLDILIWTSCYFVILKYINTKENKYLYSLAILFTIGFLNKYNIVFLILGLLPALLLTELRKVYTNKHLYFSAILALVLILPNLIWQYQNDFPVFKHLEELTKTQLENSSRFTFLSEQIMFFLGSLFVILAAFAAFFIYEPFRKYQVFFWSFLFTLVVFTYFKAKGYYAIGLYPILIAFGSVYLSVLLSKGWRRYLQPVAIIIPILLFIPTLSFLYPNVPPSVLEERYKEMGQPRWEDGKEHPIPQDFSDMLGWKEMAHKVDSALNTIQDKEHTLILCSNYGEAGAFNFYTKNKTHQAVSFNADYINWFDLSKEIKNIIMVHDLTDNDLDRDKERPLFETVEYFDEIKTPLARERGTRIHIMRDAKTDINKLVLQEIEERR